MGVRPQPNHADIMTRLQKGEGRFASMEEKLDQIIDAQASMAEQLKEVKETADATKGVVEAWDTARNFARFVKWLSGLIIAVTAIAAAIKLGASELVR